MKKSTQNIILCLVASLVVAGIALGMYIWGFLPGLNDSMMLTLPIIVGALGLLFVMAAISTCQCMRRLFIALCRYGWIFVIALVTALFAVFALIAISCAWSCLYFIALYIAMFAFIFAVLIGAAIIYTMVTLGCPKCKPEPKPVCKDTELENYNF